ncbi:MAG: phosphatase PAP2 family protein [Ornithinimicrobium sp.]|uniref:phosphatase PAP2 family protein n=1 Tax=Ornithinimicrobium sp. TaxID=1977084 RepID=UPI0026DF0FEF|nr:phosphatase PAP2 family protein [Ornithinimicrobium sp.]MDO5738799.1 phosphatase PAP2 family protein [Ornithinimicrobium sp.]
MSALQSSNVTRRWTRASILFAITVIVLLGMVFGLSYLGHEVYEAVTEGNGVAAIDHPVLDRAIALRSPALTDAAVGLTLLAGRVGSPVLTLLALGLLTWRRRDWTPVALIGATMTGALLLTIAGKSFVGRVRPPLSLALPPYEDSPSFPSGHTLNATALAVIVGYLVLLTVASRLGRALAIILALGLALGVGLSRVYLGQHWLTDVFGGWLIGTAWALSVIIAHRLWLYVRSSDR